MPRPTLRRLYVLGLCALGALAASAPAQASVGSGPPVYYPSGPQTDVPRSDLTGWTQCWSSDYGSFGTDIDTVLAGCQGAYLMLAGGPYGSSSWTVLAAAPRADVTFNTHDSDGGNTVHLANGSDWYFNYDWSWGFAHPGDPVSLNQCDVNSGTYPDQRLCWHTGIAGYATAPNSISGGFRAGSAIGLNHDPTYERAIYVSGAAPADTTAPLCGSLTVAADHGSATVTPTDADSGIASITNLKVSNGTSSISGFSPGDHSATVTITKTDPGKLTVFRFDVTDVAGNTTHCS